MSPASPANKVVFINVPGDRSSVSQRDQELQAATARAHAARVSRRPTQKSGIVKHGAGGHSVGESSPLALRPARGPQRRRAKIAKEMKAASDTQLDKQRLYAVSTSSLGQGQVDPFDSAPVKGLDNFIYSILEFGACFGAYDDCAGY